MAGEDYLFKPGVDLSDYYKSLDAMEAQTEQVVNSIDKASQKVQNSFNNQAKASIKAGEAIEQAGKKTQASIKQAGDSADKLQTSLAKTPQSAAKATGALTDLTRVVQDIPFGFTAISNNLGPLQESFQRLSKESGGVKGALSALGQSLTGAGGIGLALSVVTSLIVTYGDKIGDFFEKLNIGTGNVEKALEKQTAYNKTLKEANDILVSLADAYAQVYTDRSAQAAAAVELAKAQGKSESEIFELRQKSAAAKKLESVAILANLGLTEQDVKYNETLLTYRQEQLQAILSLVGPNKELSDYDKKRADLLKAQIDAGASTVAKGRAAIDAIKDANNEIADNAAENNRRLYEDGLKSDKALADARVLLAKKNTEEELMARISAVRAQQRQELANVNLTAGEREKLTVEANKSVEKLQNDFGKLQIQNQISLQKAIESMARQGSEDYYGARREELKLAADLELKTEGVTAEKTKEIRAKLAKDLLAIDREQIIKAAQERLNTNVNNINSQISTLGTQTQNGGRNDQIVALQQQLVTEQAELEKVSVRNSELSEKEKQSKINAIDAKAFAERKKLFDDYLKNSIKSDAEYYESRFELENAALKRIADDETKSNRERFQARQKLLDNDITILQGQLDDQEELYKKGVIDFRAYQTAINSIQGKIDADRAEKSKNVRTNQSDLFSVLGLNESDVDRYAKAASMAGQVTSDFLGAIADSYQRAIDAKQKLLDEDDKRIDELESNLDKEKDLLDQGRANNYDALQQKLKDAKEQRAADQKNLEEAQKKQDKVRKAQIIADSVAQVSNLVTASSEIFAAFSSIPIVGVPLAIAAIGVMFGAFAAAKINAIKNVGTTQQFEKGGWIHGPDHAHGGVKYVSNDGKNTVKELKGKEFVVAEEPAARARPLVEAINSMSLWEMNEAALASMLHSMGIGMASERPKEIVKIVRQRDHYKQQAALKEAKAPDISRDIKDIRESNQLMAESEKNKMVSWEDANWYYQRKGNGPIWRQRKVK